MTDREFTKLASEFLADVRERTPINKRRNAPTRGNLRLRATRGKPIASGKYRVTVSSEIAPYFPFVNYAKSFPSGKPNPNYNYLGTAIEEALNNLAKKAGGIIVRG